MGTFDQWLEERWLLPQVDLPGFSIATTGASLSEFNGRRVLAVVVDESDGTAVVVALTDFQLDALDELAAQHEGRTSSAFERAMRSFHGWLAGLDLGDNEVLGTCTDPVFAGFVLAEEQPRKDDDKG